MSTRPFIPSSWNLEQQIAAAMAKCDGGRAFLAARKEASALRWMERCMVAEVKQRRYRIDY